MIITNLKSACLAACALLMATLSLASCSSDDTKSVAPLRTNVWVKLEKEQMSISSAEQEVSFDVLWSNSEWTLDLGEGDIVSSASHMQGGNANDAKTLKTTVSLKCNANPKAEKRTQTISVVGELSTVKLVIAQDALVKGEFQVYICFGQSNMEGNAIPEAQDFEGVPDNFINMAVADNEGERQRVVGEWYDALPPLCRPKSSWNNLPGLTPVDYFGRTLAARYPDNKIGIVMIGIGGAGIEVFDPEGCDDYYAKAEGWHQATIDLYGKDHKIYSRLIEMAKKAQKDGGKIRGILMHQGETNNGQETWPGKVKTIYEAMLADLGLNAEETPLLIGETASAEDGGCCSWHNVACLPKMKNVIPNSHIISSLGCPCRDDALHFTAEGYRILGKRYADKMIELLEK